LSHNDWAQRYQRLKEAPWFASHNKVCIETEMVG